jgi:uncharacterized repeat protein (TIGR03803 family)
VGLDPVRSFSACPADEFGSIPITLAERSSTPDAPFSAECAVKKMNFSQNGGRRLARRAGLIACEIGLVVLGVLCDPARGQTVDVVTSFTVPARQPVAGLVQGTDGLFYGTTRGGGASNGGTVFKIDSSGNLTTIHTFGSFNEGMDPEAGLVLASDGKFYGTTQFGGTLGLGAVFRVDTSGNATTLYSFTGKDFSDGSHPLSPLIQASDSNFYGTTSDGGASDLGAVFKMTPAGAVTIIHSFGGSDGAYVVAGLIQGSDGKLYGTTESGGSGSGTVFRLDTSGNNFLTLHTFSITDGAGPFAALVAANGKFYGTTSAGSGTNLYGNVFSIDSGSAFAVVKSFGASDGHASVASLILGTDSNLYGTTSAGGTNDLGTVFKVTFGGTLTTLHSFASGEGTRPLANVVQGSDGNFYGTTRDGGTMDAGTVFKMTPAGTPTTLENFGGTSDGYEPEASVLQASDGNLYGSTFWGGPGNYGTIFKLTLAGTRTVVHNFTGADGSQPWSKLMQASDGKLYGTASRGGASEWGTVFSLTVGGTYSLLQSFNGTNGLGPRDSALVQRPADGLLYGMTEQGGGGSGFGNAYKVNTTGTITITSIHNFALAEGVDPSDGLLLASDGNFYGTTASAGTGDNAEGTVFKMTPAGAITILHQFMHDQFGAPPDDDGSMPMGGVIQASDGKFYGTTRVGGANSSGNVYQIDSSGNYATIHSFDGSDGREPYGNLLQGTDGKLYGTTRTGGPNNAGSIFSIDTTGANFTTVHFFTGEDGSGPVGTLILASDGKLYGTTAAGGPGKSGVVFRVTLSSCTPPPAPTAGNNGPICAGQDLHLTASTVAGATYAWTGPNGFTSGLQNPVITGATTAATGTYAVVAIVGGCASTPANTTATVRALPSAVITTAGAVCPNSSGHGASVPDAGPGATYVWSISNGTITAGAGTRSITFSTGSTGPLGLSVTVTNSNGCSAGSSVSIPFSGCLSFYSLAPCRVIDTRGATGPLGGPALMAKATRTFPVAGHCGIPSTAKALSVNVTVTQSTAAGDLRLFAGGASLPMVSTVNYGTGQTRANNAVTSLGTTGLSIRCDQPTGTTAQAIVDVNGYFQ